MPREKGQIHRNGYMPVFGPGHGKHLAVQKLVAHWLQGFPGQVLSSSQHGGLHSYNTSRNRTSPQRALRHSPSMLSARRSNNVRSNGSRSVVSGSASNT